MTYLSSVLLQRQAWTLSSAQSKTEGCKFNKDVCIENTNQIYTAPWLSLEMWRIARRSLKLEAMCWAKKSASLQAHQLLQHGGRTFSDDRCLELQSQIKNKCRDPKSSSDDTAQGGGEGWQQLPALSHPPNQLQVARHGLKPVCAVSSSWFGIWDCCYPVCNHMIS